MKGATGVSVVWILVVLLVAACGGTAPAAAPVAEATQAPAAEAASGSSTEARSETGGMGQVLEKAKAGEVVSAVIDSCTWEPADAGGPVGLNLTFSVVNNSKKQAWTTFRVMNSTGTMYRPGGTGSELTVNVGETGTKTIFTDKYDVGSDDLTLIVSARQLGEMHRVVKEELPLDNCAQP